MELHRIPRVRLTLTLTLATGLLLALAALAAAEPSVKAGKATKAQPASKIEAPAPPQGDAAHDAMMAEMLKLAVPGPQHERLKASAGKWKAVVRTWNGPGEPAVSEGVADGQMILGGRFLEQRFTSTMLNLPFEGYQLSGFDNATKRYWFFWVDNMGTGMMSGWGDMDEAGKTLTLTSTTPGPDGKLMDVKMVTNFVDENTQVWSMFGTVGGQETKMMEITYTRM
jgi:hypothetical protein